MSDDERSLDNPEWLQEMHEYRMSRRRILQAGAALAGTAAAGPLIFTQREVFAEELAAKKSNLPYNAHTNVKGDITFWHFWASPLRHGAIRTAIKQFNRYYPHVKVSDLALPFGDIWTKNTAAVAAGSGMPDVIVANRPTFWSDAKHKVYSPVTKYAKRDKISGTAFWPFTWRESVVNGQIYGLPYETDCRVLFWNRAMLADAGLNMNKGPVTWADIPHFTDKLDQKSGDQYSVVGFYPGPEAGWPGLDMTSWPWDNRTDFQNKKMYPTLNSQRMIATADWLKSWTDHYGISNLQALSSTNTPGHDVFGNGKTAFAIYIPGQQAVMSYYGISFSRKDGSKPFPYWGVGLVPHNTGGKSYSFSGGFALGMPRNAHRSAANTAAAWEFIKFMTFVGQRTWAQLTAAIPTVVNMAKHDPILSAQPHWSTFMKAMSLGHPGDRNLYDVNFPGDVIGPAQDAILTGKQSSKDALDAAQQQALENMKRNGGP